MNTRKVLMTTALGVSLILGMPFLTYAQTFNEHKAVQDERGRVVVDTAGRCVRTGWIGGGDECRDVRQVLRTTRTEIPDQDRTVYFEFNKSSLVQSEAHKLDTLTTELKSMNGISGVNIVGYADRIGTTDYNDRLSRQRAETVEKHLRAHGYLNTTIAKTRWLGESSPVTECDKDLNRSALITCLRRDRQVTVEIKYEDDKSAQIINY